MTTMTPEQIAENELICEKLLGWTRSFKIAGAQMWREAPQGVYTPSFTTWAEAGLILDALQTVLKRVNDDDASRILHDLADTIYCGNFNSAIVRAAALKYIKAVKS